MELFKLSGNILRPIPLFIVPEHKGHLLKLIQCHDKIHSKRWQLKHISRNRHKRNRNKPHTQGISNHAELGVTAPTEAATYEAGVDTLTNKTPGGHNHETAQI